MRPSLDAGIERLERMTGAGLGVYLITDRRLVGGADKLITSVEKALIGGIRAVQLREKDMSGVELLSLAAEMRSVTSKYNATLIINGSVEVALAVNADGVHLGVGSVSVREARGLMGAGKLIGVSAHTVGEAMAAAEAGADFITFGPVYFTPSKAAYGSPSGVGKLAEAARAASVPVYAIGGVKIENAGEVLSAGACGIAVISAVLDGSDTESKARGLTSRMAEASHKTKQGEPI